MINSTVHTNLSDGAACTEKCRCHICLCSPSTEQGWACLPESNPQSPEHCLGGQPTWGLCWSHGKSQHGLVCCSVGTGVWLVTEMLPVAAVTLRISVPLRECHAGDVLQNWDARRKSGIETGFTLPLRQLFFPWTLCSEVAPKMTKPQAPFSKQPF